MANRLRSVAGTLRILYIFYSIIVTSRCRATYCGSCIYHVNIYNVKHTYTAQHRDLMTDLPCRIHQYTSAGLSFIEACLVLSAK